MVALRSSERREERRRALVTGDPMKYVYLLQSVANPTKRYVGITADFQTRLKQHNAGQSPHTAKCRLWGPVVVSRFEDDAHAEAFERCLKFGSGHAFARRHFG